MFVTYAVKLAVYWRTE